MQVRPLRDDELELAWQLDRESFHQGPDKRERFLRLHVPGRTVGAFESGRLVALVSAHAFGQFFGGRSVPMAGIASMSVAPDRRGTSLARELLHVAIRDARERGECISSLFPATTNLYRSSGYEVAGSYAWRKLSPERLRALPAPQAGRVRPGDLTSDGEAIRSCYRRVAATIDGFIDRSERWWRHRAAGWSPERLFVAEDAAGRVEGYLAYRPFDGEYSAFGGPFGIAVEECVADGRDGALALWRLLGSWSTQVDRVMLRGGSEDPLLLLLPEQSFETLAELRWMLRVIDAPSAVAERGFAEGLSVEVPFTLRDSTVSENSGSWTLVVKDGRGVLERIGDAELTLDVGAFSTLYSGSGTCAGLARVGRLEGGGPAQRAALDAAFAGPAPCLIEEF